jgi:hypothetical protein
MIKRICITFVYASLVILMASAQEEVRGPEQASDHKDLRHYLDVVAGNNLFLPLGWAQEEKKTSYALSAAMSDRAIIEEIGGGESYYVSEGDTFADGIKVVDIDEQVVKLDRSGEYIELRLGEGTGGGRRGDRRSRPGGEREQRPGRGGKPEGGFRPGPRSGYVPQLETMEKHGFKIEGLPENVKVHIGDPGVIKPGQNVKFRVLSIDGVPHGEIRLGEAPAEVKSNRIVIIKE